MWLPRSGFAVVDNQVGRVDYELFKVIAARKSAQIGLYSPSERGNRASPPYWDRFVVANTQLAVGTSIIKKQARTVIGPSENFGVW